jgi:hypothetical protein
VVTDGASYDLDGVLVSIGNKAFTIPHWPGVVTGRGTAVMTPLLAWSLSGMFGTFDDAVAGTEAALPGMIDDFKLSGFNVELVIAGWSSLRRAPEAYVIKTTEQMPLNFTDEQRIGVSEGKYYVPEPMRLVKLPNLVAGPRLSPEIMIESGFLGIDINDEPSQMIERLHSAVECQRHDKNPDGKCYVGGFVQVSTVTPESTTQRILHRWQEDNIGSLIKPAPPNWTRWQTPKRNVVKMSTVRQR